MVDLKSGKSDRITLWDTEKNVPASNKAADQLRAQAVQTVAAPSAKVNVYKVAIRP